MSFSLLFLRSQNPTWPGAYCDATNFTCCYPKSGKPTADFGIHGPWPNYKDGGYPSKSLTVIPTVSSTNLRSQSF
ncbi:hypothetical protein FF2_011312 [Malus domestica]